MGFSRSSPVVAAAVTALLGLMTPGKALALARPSVAVFGMETVGDIPGATAEVLSSYLVDELRKSGAFSRVVSDKDIQTVLGLEKQRQLVDCKLESCVAELAGALGVDFIVAATIGKLATSVVFSFRLLKTGSGAAVASLSQPVCSAGDDAYLHVIALAVRHLTAQAGLVPRTNLASMESVAGCKTVGPAPAQNSDAAPSGLGRGLTWGGVAGLAAGGILSGAAVIGLLSSGALLTVVYLVPEIRRVFPAPDGNAKNRFYVAQVPSAAGAAAAAVMLVLGVVTLGAGAALLAAGMVKG